MKKKETCPKCGSQEYTWWGGDFNNCYTCKNCGHEWAPSGGAVKTMIVRNVSEELHRDVKILAARLGVSINALIIETLTHRVQEENRK